MSVALRFRFAPLVVAALVAACSDSSTGPSTPNVPDVASLIGEMSVSGIGSAVSVASPQVGLVFSASPTFAPANCVFTPSTGYFAFAAGRQVFWAFGSAISFSQPSIQGCSPAATFAFIRSRSAWVCRPPGWTKPWAIAPSIAVTT